MAKDRPGPHRLEDMTNFDLPWCKDLFARPDFKVAYFPDRHPPPPADVRGKFVLFSETLWTEKTIRAWCPFTLEDPSNTVSPYTHGLLVALGDGLDMTTGNLGGGITATLMDVAMSFAATRVHGAPVTVKLDLDYKNPITTPCVLVCNVHVTKIEGRKCFTRGTIEDGKGKVLAQATSLFVRPPGEEGKLGAQWLMAALNKDSDVPRPRI